MSKYKWFFLGIASLLPIPTLVGDLPLWKYLVLGGLIGSFAYFERKEFERVSNHERA